MLRRCRAFRRRRRWLLHRAALAMKKQRVAAAHWHFLDHARKVQEECLRQMRNDLNRALYRDGMRKKAG